MESLVVIEGNDEAKFDDITVAKSSSAPSSPREITDPVVYKLVRVDVDGRLVPATDDEVVEVEDLLEDEKSEICPVADVGQNVGLSMEEFPQIQFKCSEGQSENAKVVAERSNQLHHPVDIGNTVQLEENVISKSNESHIEQSGTGADSANPSDGSIKDETSTLTVSASSRPDFSKLEGEICLDNLSVRELHETFKATFGRETSVKDKQWLKRRIAMGLSNSCDVSTMTFVIKDNKVVTKDKEESLKTVDSSLVKDLEIGNFNENDDGLPIGCGNQIEDLQNVSGKRCVNPSLENEFSGEDQRTEQRVAKRVRKPTKRYIEELSEVESREDTGKLISTVKNSGPGQSSPRSHVRPARDMRMDGRPVATRQDSLGGSDVEVPYVCRVRRSRPRENIMALMKLQPSGMGMAAKLVKKAFGVCVPRQDSEMGNKVFKVRSAPGWIQKPHIDEPEKGELYLERKESKLEKDTELKHNDSGVNSDDYAVTVPTAKGGIRRKHHRPWTLSEVVKLVEGVAKYGAGRWSEIKRLAFASYSYRTSVDLKDKWRNLLRASLQSPAEKGVQNSRKHASVPIPAPILLRVRELAEMQAQAAPNLSSKFAMASGRNVNETGSGYL